MTQEILIASDHAGFELKKNLIAAMPDIKWKDLGTRDTSSVDYPDYADALSVKINKDPSMRGILICGSGQGMCMRANKYPNVRAALGYNEEIVRLSREHNDANILCLGGRFISTELALKLLRIFFITHFVGGRHESRVEKIKAPLKP